VPYGTFSWFPKRMLHKPGKLGLHEGLSPLFDEYIQVGPHGLDPVRNGHGQHVDAVIL